jgi:hypothetical protein
MKAHVRRRRGDGRAPLDEQGTGQSGVARLFRPSITGHRATKAEGDADSESALIRHRVGSGPESLELHPAGQGTPQGELVGIVEVSPDR